MKEVWILTNDSGMESRAFRTRERARAAFQEYLGTIEKVSDLHHNEVDDTFEYWTYHNDFERVEVCIEKVEIED